MHRGSVPQVSIHRHLENIPQTSDFKRGNSDSPILGLKSQKQGYKGNTQHSLSNVMYKPERLIKSSLPKGASQYLQTEVTEKGDR